jgi:hypothetical protein
MDVPEHVRLLEVEQHFNELVSILREWCKKYPHDSAISSNTLKTKLSDWGEGVFDPDAPRTDREDW